MGVGGEEVTALAAKDHVRDLVRASGSSFTTAMRMLPRVKREAMYAIYAFCREVDDIADEPGETDDKRFRLGQWRGEIERLYGGRPRLAVSLALSCPVEQFGLGKEDFRAIIDGMEMDAVDGLRIADMDELSLYCDRVACAVGRLSCRVFGVADELGRPLAFALGQALQLTNILRDLHEDARRDRLYLPADLLQAHGINQDAPDAVVADPAVAAVCELLADIARRRFAEARSALAACDRRQVRPAVMMMAAYRRILARLMRRGWRNVAVPVALSPLEKLWIVLRHGIV